MDEPTKGQAMTTDPLLNGYTARYRVLIPLDPGAQASVNAIHAAEIKRTINDLLKKFGYDVEPGSGVEFARVRS